MKKWMRSKREVVVEDGACAAFTLFFFFFHPPPPGKMPTTLVVAGATGWLGLHVVEAGIRAGFKVGVGGRPRAAGAATEG